MFIMSKTVTDEIFDRLATEINFDAVADNKPADKWQLEVSEDGRRLQYQNGSPFFYFADTGWEMLHRCSKSETIFYLKDRQQKGFNVIQTVILAEKDGLNVPNREGETPFITTDPIKLNEAYFQHIDWCLEQARKMGLYLALLPTWGDKWNKLSWGKGPEIFNTAEKAADYGRMLGERYREQPNIIWILGGDRNPTEPRYIDINNAMAEGIRSQVKDAHLMSYHPAGCSSSSTWFHNASWLDFNMAQTGHNEKNNYLTLIEHDYKLKPVKPCLNGEPQYEAINVNFNPDNERFTAYDARQAAYWSVLSGTLGHTYGHNSIWQMWLPEELGKNDPHLPWFPWYYALQSPGALQMSYMRQLFAARPFEKLNPVQDILVNVYGQNRQEIRAAGCSEGSFVIVYSAFGNPIHLDLAKLSGDVLTGYWYNPREGSSKKIASFKNSQQPLTMVPPSSGCETDWVLVLDDADKQYADPAVG